MRCDQEQNSIHTFTELHAMLLAILVAAVPDFISIFADILSLSILSVGTPDCKLAIRVFQGLSVIAPKSMESAAIVEVRQRTSAIEGNYRCTSCCYVIQAATASLLNVGTVKFGSPKHLTPVFPGSAPCPQRRSYPT